MKKAKKISQLEAKLYEANRRNEKAETAISDILHNVSFILYPNVGHVVKWYTDKFPDNNIEFHKNVPFK